MVRRSSVVGEMMSSASTPTGSVDSRIVGPPSGVQVPSANPPVTEMPLNSAMVPAE